MRRIVAESRRHGASRPPAGYDVRIDAATGLLAGARQVLSPNFDARPAGTKPELLVVHGISLPPGEFGGPWIDRLFTGDRKSTRLNSSHLTQSRMPSSA